MMSKNFNLAVIAGDGIGGHLVPSVATPDLWFFDEVGLGVGIGLSIGVTLIPLPHTNFFPDLMHINFKFSEITLLFIEEQCLPV